MKHTLALDRSGPALLLASLLAFSSSASAGQEAANDPRDPWEGYNRVIYSFNDGVDTLLLKPVATVYDTLMPQLLDDGVTNFFSNLGDISNALNNFLQGKPGDGFGSLGRLAINSTVGVLGLFDVATNMGLQKSEEDFGQTMAAMGIGPGPYFVLPLLGPSTVRDAFGTPVDIATNPVTWLDDSTTRLTATGVDIVDIRAGLLATEEAVEGIAEDEYVLVRNAWLDQRQYDVTDGEIADDFYEVDASITQ